MNSDATERSHGNGPYLTALGAWALSFGCAVGWGAFILPGTTLLPQAGPVGTFMGIALGTIAMMVIAANYHFLMNRYPDDGGTYTYTKKCFGYDHGLLNAWFLILTYIAVIWANATAIPLVGRTLLGNVFQFGFHYDVAGYRVYFGEILIVVLALSMAALICLRRKTAEIIQIVMAVLLFGGIVTCVAAVSVRTGETMTLEPAFSPVRDELSGVMTIFALAPWAFVGFESITHSAGEAKFDLKKSFKVMFISVITIGAAYGLLVLLAVMKIPEGCATWVEYLGKLNEYSGARSQATFGSAYNALGDTGTFMLGIAAVCGMFTGIIGSYIALSRLIAALSEDEVMGGWFGKRNSDGVPENTILIILIVSVVFPLIGRNAISWIVDVTTVSATIAYIFASAACWRTAKKDGIMLYQRTGIAGMILSAIFALGFLVPNMLSVQTLARESYLILAAWGILGFIVFRYIFKHVDKEARLGRSAIAWIVLLGIIIFTSSVWLLQETDSIIAGTMMDFERYYGSGIEISGKQTPVYLYLFNVLQKIDKKIMASLLVQVGLIVSSLAVMFDVFSHVQKRERQTEIEKLAAENASRAKTSFLSNMSHEIRTPMNAIIGLDSIALRNTELQPKTREQLEKIGASARHLLGLINDILDMSRIESGRMVLKDEEFATRELIDQVNIIINGQCQDKGLHYECNIVGRVRDYYIGDDMKIKQVIINILGNSVKFTDVPGNVALTVEALEETEDASMLRFIMKDTGVGMDEEFIPKIFEAFSQEDATATNRYGGSGLGMAITKNFIEMMEGDIKVESKKGVGSTFTVTIPLKPSDRKFEKPEDLSLPEGLRIIMVDDDEVSCDHGRNVLEDIGADFEISMDPVEALDKIRRAHEEGNDYGLVITDYKMPSLTGLELTRKIRDFDDGKTAVIILTGYNWDIIEEEAAKDGVDGIIAKPLFPGSVLREIHNVLMNRAGGQGSQAEIPVAVERDLAGRRVLMAEDVEQNAEILMDLLEIEDVSAEHAQNGKIAVDMFMEHPAGYYDAILMDVRMPVMDGLAATRAIRALGRPDAVLIPIIAMTANVFDEDVEKTAEAGMDAHLAKPIEPEKMFDTMARLIAERSSETVE